MDTVSSATLSMMETPLRRAKSNVAGATAGASTVVELDGVGLTVPYFIAASVGAVADPEQTRGELEACVRECFATTEKIFSPFYARSELNVAVNGPQCAPHTWCTISREMFDVLTICDVLHDLSGNSFDPTAVTLGKWYVAECERRGAASLPPDDEELQERRALVGWRKFVELRRDAATGECALRKAAAGVTLDPSAVSKGWCVDLLCRELQLRCLIFDVYIDWGGDITARGRHPSGREWGAGIQNPLLVAAHTSAAAETKVESPQPAGPKVEEDGKQGGRAVAAYDDETVAMVALTEEGGLALCTSGDYNSVRFLDFHHMTDPHRGEPMRVGHCASVSVVCHRSCAVADGCASAMLLLQTDEAMRAFVAAFNNSFSAALHRVRHGAAAMDDPAAAQPLVLHEHIHRHVALFRPQRADAARGDAFAAAKCTVRLRFSPWSNPPPQAAASGGTAGGGQKFALAPEDAARLRLILRAIPRAVFILVVTVAAEAEEGEEQEKQPPGRDLAQRHFACTMTSPVALTAGAVIGFAMRESFLGVVLRRVAAATSDVGAAFSILPSLGPLSIAATEAADAFGRGVWLNQTQLEQHPVVGGAMGLRRPCAVQPADIFDVGDHIAFVARFESESAGALPAASGTVMRLRRGYESVATPRAAPPSLPLLLPPRVLCIATVTRFVDEARAKPSTLATVLVGVDCASRAPLIMTAVCKDTKLNRALFLTPSGAPTLVGVRIHFFTNDRDVRGLADWFGDGSVVRPDEQFLYHPAPDHRRLELLGGDVPLVPYTFADAKAWVDCVLLSRAARVFAGRREDGADVSPAGPMLLRLAPLRCGGIADGTLDRPSSRLAFTFAW